MEKGVNMGCETSAAPYPDPEAPSVETKIVPPFERFISGVADLVNRNAAKKGYNDTGAEGKNDLFDFCNKFFPGHSLGEIVYKAVRYSKKRNKEDLLKIAAWAYLEWLHDKTEPTL